MESNITEVIQNIRESFEDIVFDPKRADEYLINIQDRAEKLRLVERNLRIDGMVHELVATAIQQINIYLCTDYPDVEFLWPVFKTRSELFKISGQDLLLEEPKYAEAMGDLAFVYGDYEAADIFYFDAVFEYVSTKPANHLESADRCRDKRHFAQTHDNLAASDISQLGERKANYPVQLMSGMWEEEIPRMQKVADYLNRMTLNKRTALNNALESYTMALRTTSLVPKPPMSLGG